MNLMRKTREDTSSYERKWESSGNHRLLAFVVAFHISLCSPCSSNSYALRNTFDTFVKCKGAHKSRTCIQNRRHCDSERCAPCHSLLLDCLKEEFPKVGPRESISAIINYLLHTTYDYGVLPCDPWHNVVNGLLKRLVPCLHDITAIMHNARRIKAIRHSSQGQTTKCRQSPLSSTSVSAFAWWNSRSRLHNIISASTIRKILNTVGFKLCFSVAVGGTFNVVAKASIITSKNTITWTEAYSIFGTVQTFKSGDGQYYQRLQKLDN